MHFKLIVDSCVWAFKHTHRDIADTGLKICLALLKNISKSDTATANVFYQTFYLSLFTDVFYVLTDSEHKSGFQYQASILAHLFEIVESDSVKVPLFDVNKYPQITDNKTFLRDFLANMLSTTFTHLQRYINRSLLSKY